MIDNYFFCSICDDEYNANYCDVHDIIDARVGRKYLFTCPMCGEPQTSELIIVEGVEDSR